MTGISKLVEGLEPHTPVSGRRPLYIERFADRTAYAINLEYPTGVYYLSSSAADLLDTIVFCDSNIEHVTRELQRVKETESRNLLGKLILPEIYSATARPPTQLSVWFHISNSCNLTCSYCYIPGLRKGVSTPIEDTTPSSDNLRKIIVELLSICRRRGFKKLLLRFAGGEPALSVGLLEKICFLAECESQKVGIEIAFAILTNGTLVTERFINLLKTCNFTGLSISIDGSQENHDHYRFKIEHGELNRKVGTWKEIKKNIDLLRETGVIKPYVLTTLTADNYPKITELIDYCVDKKIGFRLSPVRDKKTSQIPELQEAITGTLKGIYESLPQRLPITRPIQNYANFAEWSPRKKKSVACGACRSSIAVSHKGDVSSCQMRLETVCGNLMTQSGEQVFKQLVEHPSNWRFVNPNEQTGGCIYCLWRYTCSGGCPEHTKLAFATYDSPSPWCKLYGDFLPIYLRAIGTQMKLSADRT